MGEYSSTRLRPQFHQEQNGGMRVADQEDSMNDGQITAWWNSQSPFLRLAVIAQRNEMKALGDPLGSAPLVELYRAAYESMPTSLPLPSIRVFKSRHTPGLVPGEGESIHWEIGEVVRIIDGQDTGRTFKIDSLGMSHKDAPGKFIREGYFTDEPESRYGIREEAMWFL